jgi:hypothetical protein
MYQPCTSTAVNHGELRGLAADLRRALSRADAPLPGVLEAPTISLITRRSQVQILPPPPTEIPGQRPFSRDRRWPLSCSKSAASDGVSTGPISGAVCGGPRIPLRSG